MTTEPNQTAAQPHPHSFAGAVPPPSCPAHQFGGEQIARLFGPVMEADPQAMYESLRREHGTVAPVLLPGDLPAWLVLGYREILEVTRSPARFTRDSRHWRLMQEGLVPADSPLRPLVQWQPNCIFVDGEEHRRLRSALTDGLTSFDRRGIRRYVIRYTEQLIDRFAARGSADLVGEFATKLPMLVMQQMLGISENDAVLADATHDLFEGSETALQSNEIIVGELRSLTARKKIDPGHDLASLLIGHVAGLSDDEVVEHLRLTLIASTETTANLIANTLRVVLTDHRFRAHLAGGHMTLPDAVEQVLWDEPPLSTVPGRWAIGDTMLGGRRIRRGDLLMLGLKAGNVDPEIRPDLSTPLHGNRSHLSFSNGPHECPGQEIGRAIADTSIDTLLARLPDLRLAVDGSELRARPAWLSRRPESLPVTFTPPPEPVTSSHHTNQFTSATAQPLPAAAVMPAPQATSPAPHSPRRPQRPSWWQRLTNRRHRR